MLGLFFFLIFGLKNLNGLGLIWVLGLGLGIMVNVLNAYLNHNWAIVLIGLNFTLLHFLSPFFFFFFFSLLK